MSGRYPRGRAFGAGVAALAVAWFGLQVTASGQTYYVPVTGDLVLHGRGYGHGHGMSQYGAQGAALQGRSYRQILHFYYPHTQRARRSGPVRVLLSADTSSDVVVQPAPGLRVRALSDRHAWTLSTRAAIDSWRIKPLAKNPSRDAVSYHNGHGWHRWSVPGRDTLPADVQFEAATPLGLVLPNGSVVRYRGALRSASPSPGASARDTVNVVSMDDYVRGVVAAEMPASWAQAALRAQAVAARTYAAYLGHANAGRYYGLCDTTACQVYGGASAETSATDTAVAKTAGVILTYAGAPALTQFSASSGGWTASGGQPYLPAQKDPFDKWPGNGVHTWSTQISASSLASRYPQLGRLLAVKVTQRDGHGRWGGRVLRLVLKGSGSNVALTGDELRSAYGLRSTWFSFQPTAIISAWHRMGGRKSALGSPKSPELAVRGAHGRSGAKQVFTGGRAYWSAATGAHALHGTILRRYRHARGPASRYGFPVTGVLRAAGGGHKARFSKGMFFASRRTGPQPVYGRILAAFAHRHYAAGRLGFPVTAPQPVKGGLRSRFQHGSIRWDRRTDKLTVTLRHR